MMDVEFEDKQALVRLPWPPPPEKDALKALGARWDPEKKLWRISISPSIVRWFLAHGVEVPEDVVGALEENLAASHAADVDMVLPSPDGLEYRPFQKAGVAWALSHEGTLIGDDMGLGKTVEALGVVNADSTVNSVLVVCPLSVALNWKAEAGKWLTREASIGVASSKELPDTDVVIAHWGSQVRTLNASRQTIQVPCGETVLLSQRPSSPSNWPFSHWLVNGTRSNGDNASFTANGRVKVSAIYALSSGSGSGSY